MASSAVPVPCTCRAPVSKGDPHPCVPRRHAGEPRGLGSGPLPADPDAKPPVVFRASVYVRLRQAVRVVCLRSSDVPVRDGRGGLGPGPLPARPRPQAPTRVPSVYRTVKVYVQSTNGHRNPSPACVRHACRMHTHVPCVRGASKCKSLVQVPASLSPAFLPKCAGCHGPAPYHRWHNDSRSVPSSPPCSALQRPAPPSLASSSSAHVL